MKKTYKDNVIRELYLSNEFMTFRKQIATAERILKNIEDETFG